MTENILAGVFNNRDSQAVMHNNDGSVTPDFNASSNINAEIAPQAVITPKMF